MTDRLSTCKQVFIYIMIFSFAGVLRAANLNNQQPIELIQTASTSVTLQCEPKNWRADSTTIDGRVTLRYRFDYSDFWEAEPGVPGIAIASASIGAPENAQVRISVLTADYHEIQHVRITPSPTVRYKNGLPEMSYIPKPETYQSNGLLPADIVEIARDGRFRDQRIVGIRFSPMQVIPGKDIVRLYHKIIVRIDFGKVESSAKQTGMQPSVAEERLYRGVVLNYEQAKNWRIKDVRPSLKKSAGLTAIDLYKVPVRNEGMYKLTGSFLQSNGVNLSSIKPAYIKMYNNGGRELPHSLSASRPDSLTEIAIYVEDGGDNVFNEGDYILFYGVGVTGWDYDASARAYSHYINHYTEENTYWLAFDESQPGRRMQSRSVLPQSAGELQTQFNARHFLELEQNNLHNSGMVWYGPGFTRTASEHTFNILLPAASQNDSATFKFEFLGYTYSTHRFDITINDLKLAPIQFDGNTEKEVVVGISGGLKSGLNAVKMQYTTTSDANLAYFDWFEVTYQAHFKANDDKLFFNAPISSTPAAYEINGFSSNSIEIFDVTDLANVSKISNVTISDQKAAFADSCDPAKSRTYLAIAPAKYSTPARLVKDSPSSLRSAQNGGDFIIIYHSDFEQQANRLAEHRRQFDGLSVMVVDIQDIYDEFSWGLFDPVSIRDFLKFAFYNWNPVPRIVLLFGDGDFDYKNVLSQLDKNWIPPYETSEHSEIRSRAMDDWYTYIVGSDAINDLAIGRFTVRTTTEAQNLVDKIISYDSTPYMGDWKNTITVIADDEYIGGAVSSTADLIHVDDAEDLSEGYIPKTFNLKKIYLMEYPAIKSASISGIRKPAAGEDLIDQINRGTLILNYVGHGNETLWSHERILTASQDLDKIQNQDRLPIWIAATCAWGRYDMPDIQSMSEELLTFKDRGAIAILTASREAYASPNAQLNKLFFQNLFQLSGGKWKIGQTMSIGEALMQAKIQHTSWDENDQKYHIFGDPAMHLAVPRYQAHISSIKPDSIKALSKIRVTGRILKDEVPWNDFKGKILLTAFDSKKNRTYVTSEDISVHYILPGNAIFRGPALVENGQFDMSFIVPKDITYGGNFGRLSLYFWNDEIDGTGKRDSLAVGGTATNIVDKVGPEIKLGLKGFPLGSEAITTPKAILYAEIEDSVSGVNITGEIGHTIMVTLDNQLDNKKDATEFFIFDEGSWSRGTFEFPLGKFVSGSGEDGTSTTTGLSAGEHVIEVKAWDNFNNSSSATLQFTVISEDKLVLSEVMNYPNPFSTKTAFTFFTNHDANITIKIYTIAGRLIKTLRHIYSGAGVFNQIEWDGKDEDDNPLANGVYLYKINARGALDEKLNSNTIGRLIIMK
ncbi:type IX secretion system sortase PorU [candidate division KSB1 bacterium]|nr:type IX secretion system sortase PorU [candidate division KSB1 bacterium]